MSGRLKGYQLNVLVALAAVITLFALSACVEEDKALVQRSRSGVTAVFQPGVSSTTTIRSTTTIAASSTTTSTRLTTTTAATTSSVPTTTTASGSEYFNACMQSSGKDACLIDKNPVAALGAALPGDGLGPTTNLSSAQTLAVTLTGLDSSGYLQNATIKVTAPTRTTKNAQGNWMYNYSICASATASTCTMVGAAHVAQLMTYYWLQKLAETFAANAGSFFATGKNIEVKALVNVPDNAYWDSGNNSISLGVFNSGKNLTAMSAEVAAHEMGHANFHYGSHAAPVLYDDAGADASGNYVCSTSGKGCGSAINEGVGDYHVTMLFPSKTGVGETLENSTNPTKWFLGRNPKTNTWKVTYVNSTYGGEIHYLGSVYSAIWYNIRAQAASVGGTAAEVDKLFAEHMKGFASINSADFAYARDMAVSIDSSLFAGRYSNLIRTAFNDRIN